MKLWSQQHEMWEKFQEKLCEVTRVHCLHLANKLYPVVCINKITSVASLFLSCSAERYSMGLYVYMFILI